MKTSKIDGISRRTFLGAAAGASIVGAARPLFATTALGNSALAFAGGTVFAAGTSLLRSDDVGATWHDSVGPDRRPTALTAHPKRAERLIAALEGGEVAVSEDNGKSWRKAGAGLPALSVDALATAAKLPDTLYAAVAGDGLWRSEDAGESWEFVMDRPFIAGEEQDVLSLASVDLASGMGGIWLYGGSTVGLQRVPDCFCRWQDVQPAHALDALVDGAKAPAMSPLPAGEPVRALVSSAAAPNRLWAGLPSGVWASTDAGLVWSKANALAAIALASNPTNPDILVAATSDGLFHSEDAGLSWTASTIL